MRHLWWIVAAAFGAVWALSVATHSAVGGLGYGLLIVSFVAILVRIINGRRMT